MCDSKITPMNEATSKRRPVIKLNKAQTVKPGESELLINLGIIKDVSIYESSKAEDPILGGQYKYLKLKNFYNRLTDSSRTFAYMTTLNGESVVKNSDFLTTAIGQKSYDLLFHALCSVLSNEAKIKAMLALLTVPNKYKDNSTQTDINDFRSTGYYDTADIASQTNILTPLNILKNMKKQYRNKKRLVPYVVPNDNSVQLENECIVNKPYIQKIVISRGNFKRVISNDLPVLENVHKDLDRERDSNLRDLSIGTVGSFFDHSVESVLSDINQNIDKAKNIENTVKESDKLDEEIEVFDRCLFELYDGSVVTLPTRPKTIFHIMTRTNLDVLSREEKMKLIYHQTFIDWKLCLQRNEDGNLPIHLAVLDNGVDFLVRQCVVLRSKNSKVDVFTLGRKLSPLHMAIMRGSNIECVEKLLEFQADPLDALEDDKTAFHRAAEASNPTYIEKLFEHVAKYPRELLTSHSLLTEDTKCVTSEQKEHLTSYLYQRISEICDEEGYTPLMLASKLARYQNVRLLLEKCSSTINVGMKTSGNTALYLAVEGAGMDALERGDKNKVSDDYLKTIECLLDHNADPGVQNFTGGSVSKLLKQFSILSLSMFMAQKMYRLRRIAQTKKIDEFMLIRESAAATTSRSSDVMQMKQAVVFKKVEKTIEPDRIEVSKKVARPKQKSDSLVDTKSGGSEKAIQEPKKLDPKQPEKKQFKPVILKNRKKLPDKILAKGSPIAFVDKRSSMINVSLNSQLTVPKKMVNNIKTVKDVSFNRDACKRKLSDHKELQMCEGGAFPQPFHTPPPQFLRRPKTTSSPPKSTW